MSWRSAATMVAASGPAFQQWDLADQGAGQVPQSRATGDAWPVGQAHLDA
jgi:hypothetical protein